MIVAWMFYCSVCALGLTLAGVLAERLLLAGRAPVRVVWVGALFTSLVLPAIVFRVSSYTVVPSTSTAAAAPLDDAAAIAITPSVASVVPLRTSVAEPKRDWRVVLPALDQPLLFAWAALSAAMALSFGGGFLALAWMRRTWERREVQGLSVYVSQRTGPAVVGALSPSIVVPEWALALESSQLTLMLRHEQEHLRARDGQMLIAAQIALILMPWNLALWWQVLSLRVAIEMDCDARVLRHADARTYGELLLEVARPHRGLSLAGMIAFAERATQLERRIRVLKRHRSATSRRKGIAAGGVVLLATTAAWVAPHPPAPLHAASAPVTPTLTTMTLPAAHDVIPSVPATLPVRKPLVRLVAQPIVRLECASDTSIVGATYRYLFDGITLGRDNESRACAVLARLADEQLAEDAVAEASAMTARGQRATIQTNRDAALVTLLHTDADRAAFATNSSRTAPASFGGGRSGGAGGVLRATIQPLGAPAGVVSAQGGGRVGRGNSVLTGDTLIITGGARATMSDADAAAAEQRMKVLLADGSRAGVLTRGGAGGVGGVIMREDTLSAGATVTTRLGKELSEVRAAATAPGVEANYRRLFDGIALAPDDEAQARKLLNDAQQESMAVPPPMRPGTRLRLIPARGVAQIVAGADTELTALVPNDADRAKLRARLIVVPQ